MTDYSTYRVNPITMPPQGDPRDYLWTPRLPHDTAIPSQMLLDEVGVVDPNMRDQGAEGACTGHAEELIRINDDLLAGRPLTPYSRAFLYYESRKREGTQTQDAGAQLRDGLQVMVDEGVPLESFMPYVAGNFAIPPSPDAYANASPGKIARYEALPSVNYVWQAIGAEKRAVAIACGWYAEWDNLDSTGIMPAPKNLRGYHAPAVCGYQYLNNPATGKPELYLRIHNSWGRGWGLNGHGWLAASMFDNQGVVFERWVSYGLDTPKPDPTPTPTPTPTPDPNQQALRLQSEIAFVSMGRGLKAVGADLSGLIKKV